MLHLRNICMFTLTLLLISEQMTMKPWLYSHRVSHIIQHVLTSVTCRQITWQGSYSSLPPTLITVVPALPRHSPTADRIMAFWSSLVGRWGRCVCAAWDDALAWVTSSTLESALSFWGNEMDIDWNVHVLLYLLCIEYCKMRTCMGS